MTSPIYTLAEPLFSEVEAFFSKSENLYLADLCERAGIAQFSNIIHDRVALVKTRNDLLAVAIVGTFKAGKSTLINALIGKEVAYVDTFEATTTTAFIYPGPQEGVSIIVDGNRQFVTIDAYLLECEKKRLAHISRVDITSNHKLPLILIDTPGMGTVTQQHEDRADNAVLASDLVLWVMDPNELLTALDAAFLKRAQEIGLPVWCLLSKIDEFSDDEINDCIQCLIDRLGLDEENIIPVSAIEHINSGNNAGISHLIDRLLDEVKRSPVTKQKAVRALTVELLNETQQCLLAISNECEGDIQLIDSQVAVLKDNSDGINKKVAERIQEKMVSSMTSFLKREISNHLASSASADSVIDQAWDKYMKMRYPNDVKEASHDLEKLAKSLWSQDFTARANDLQRQIDMLIHQASHDSSTLDYLKNQLQSTKELKKAFDDGFNVWPYAVATAALALLFPHGLLIAGGLVAGATGYDQISKHARSSKRSEALSELHAELEQLSNKFVELFIREAILPALDELLDKAIDRYCQMQCCGIDRNGLIDISASLNRLRDEAIQLLSGSTSSISGMPDDMEWIGVPG